MPQTNGRVKRFNGRIGDVLQSHHFRSGKEIEATLQRYIWLYSQQLPQAAPGNNPLAGHKRTVQNKPAAVHKTPMLPCGI
ncbi:MAG: hypothetical protein GDA39_08385 [Hyphomonadaceae bacterium]|nr:hypothetical protein [Hyphomonadaceae bacterium]MBC6412873.1 hypothetical protein [Hyphomonadaceae bacterium]